ncbi:MAG: hypothetical protein ACREUA_06300 [Burkholderiales bacterium]
MNRFKTVIYGVVLVACLLVVDHGHAAQSVALVTDMEGSGILQSKHGKVPISILAELETDTDIVLAAHSRLVMVYLTAGSEFELRGPGRFVVSSANPLVLEGRLPVRRALLNPIYRDAKIRSSGLIQASLAMRSAAPRKPLEMIEPIGAKLLDAQPRFHWVAAERGVLYRFRLADGSGQTLLDTEVKIETLNLPANVALEEGQTYRWSVEAQFPDGRRLSNHGEVQMLEADHRQRIEQARPQPHAPLAQRVLFATLLEQFGLRDEARKYWSALAKERPHDQRLSILARGEHGF